MADLSLLGELTLIQFCLTYMSRKGCKKRVSLGMAATHSLERVIGDTEQWYKFAALMITAMGAGYQRRLELIDRAWDLLHDIMCELFPELDDGIRYEDEK